MPIVANEGNAAVALPAGRQGVCIQCIPGPHNSIGEESAKAGDEMVMLRRAAKPRAFMNLAKPEILPASFLFFFIIKHEEVQNEEE